MPSELSEPNELTKPKVMLKPEDHTQGPEDASVTLLEYGDYQCPHCGQAAPVIKRLQQQFGERLQYAWRHFPLTEIHEMAEPAAEAAEWAGALGRFWEMHDLLLANQKDLSDETLLESADAIGADDQDLREALQQGAFEESVAADVESGEEAGVHGTPTFFINGEKYEGSWDYESLERAIQNQINRREKRVA